MQRPLRAVAFSVTSKRRICMRARRITCNRQTVARGARCWHRCGSRLSFSVLLIAEDQHLASSKARWPFVLRCNDLTVVFSPWRTHRRARTRHKSRRWVVCGSCPAADTAKHRRVGGGVRGCGAWAGVCQGTDSGRPFLAPHDAATVRVRHSAAQQSQVSCWLERRVPSSQPGVPRDAPGTLRVIPRPNPGAQCLSANQRVHTHTRTHTHVHTHTACARDCATPSQNRVSDFSTSASNYSSLPFVYLRVFTHWFILIMETTSTNCWSVGRLTEWLLIFLLLWQVRLTDGCKQLLGRAWECV